MRRFIFIIIAITFSCPVISGSQLGRISWDLKGDEVISMSSIAESAKKVHLAHSLTTTFEASVHLLNQRTLYLCLSVIFSLPEDYKPEIANIAAFNAASGKPVCSFSTNGALAFSCEMYAKEANPFVAVLPEMLHALTTSAANFQEEYEKAEKSYTPLVKVGGFTASNVDDTEFIYPQISSNGDSKLYIEKVTLNPNSTVLDMVSYNGRQYQNCTISRNSYISVNGKRYQLTKVEGITYAPQYTDYPGYDSGREVSLHFKLYFPALPKGTTVFDFSEGTVDGWQINGIELKHGNSYSINGEQIDTPYHKWGCVSIEVQDGQTILTKTVQPKSVGTFMYSSQDEYIEDADTGRKYYLRNSSIGFEGSPEISYDTKTITFYEIYPALPVTVKRINISSGTQYYVKGLQIR